MVPFGQHQSPRSYGSNDRTAIERVPYAGPDTPGQEEDSKLPELLPASTVNEEDTHILRRTDTAGSRFKRGAEKTWTIVKNKISCSRGRGH